MKYLLAIVLTVAFVGWFIWFDGKHPCTRIEQRFAYDPALKIPRVMPICVERKP